MKIWLAHIQFYDVSINHILLVRASSKQSAMNKVKKEYGKSEDDMVSVKELQVWVKGLREQPVGNDLLEVFEH